MSENWSLTARCRARKIFALLIFDFSVYQECVCEFEEDSSSTWIRFWIECIRHKTRHGFYLDRISQ